MANDCRFHRGFQLTTQIKVIIMTRKLKMGMVGGGRDAFIGGVHLMATRLDGEIELVAGAFSSEPEKAKRSGEDLSIESERVYRDYQTMSADSDLPFSRGKCDIVHSG
jgi:hypothetical protein